MLLLYGHYQLFNTCLWNSPGISMRNFGRGLKTTGICLGGGGHMDCRPPVLTNEAPLTSQDEASTIQTCCFTESTSPNNVYKIKIFHCKIWSCSSRRPYYSRGTTGFVRPCCARRPGVSGSEAKGRPVKPPGPGRRAGTRTYYRRFSRSGRGPWSQHRTGPAPRPSSRDRRLVSGTGTSEDCASPLSPLPGLSSLSP